MNRLALALAAALALAGCKEEAETALVPVAMTDESLGHYCQMYIADHPGPKAQVHLKGRAEPLWFSQVSDAVAYLHDPERQADIRAVFVSDMGAAESWAVPGAGNWTPADTASLVIDSDRPGGMGVPEAIPFADPEAARAFVAEHGGRILRFDQVPEAYVRPDMTATNAHAHEEITQ